MVQEQQQQPGSAHGMSSDLYDLTLTLYSLPRAAGLCRSNVTVGNSSVSALVYCSRPMALGETNDGLCYV